jgi:hypothetical protein
LDKEVYVMGVYPIEKINRLYYVQGHREYQRFINGKNPRRVVHQIATDEIGDRHQLRLFRAALRQI